jgi:hypothetical protein
LIVPKFDLITRGYINNSSLILASRGTIDLSIAGGYKFGGKLLLNLESDDLGDITSPTNLTFKAASITAREFLTLPIDFTYFTGEYETLASGDVFPRYFGTEPIASRYSGYMYFPEGVRYEGIHEIAGTGFAVNGSERIFKRFVPYLYAYQDGYLGEGFYSIDVRGLLNLELLKLEAFGGWSFPVAKRGQYRFGLLLFYETGTGGEFLTQVGIPKWNTNDPFSIELFYFLFEPRVRIGALSIIFTLFWHPSYYLQQATNELGYADINVNFMIGDLETRTMSGGVESALDFRPSEDSQIEFIISPYFSAITSGVIWNFKVNGQLFPFSVESLFEFFIGVKAEF